MSKVYELTGEGRRKVRVPGKARDEILDHLYEFKTAREEELLALCTDARTRLNKFKRERLVREVT